MDDVATNRDIQTMQTSLARMIVSASTGPAWGVRVAHRLHSTPRSSPFAPEDQPPQIGVAHDQQIGMHGI